MEKLVLSQPTNQLAAVLAAMICYEGVSERDTPFNGFRTRISELKNEHKLPIKTRKEEFENQFKRKSRYNVHYIKDSDKQEAVIVYNKINSEKSGN